MIDFNLQLASVKDSGDLLKRVCHGAGELIGAQHAYLCVREKGNGTGIYLYTSGLSEAETERLPSAEMHYDLMAKVLDQWIDSRIVNPTGDPRAVGFLADYPEIRQGLVAPITSLSYLYGWIFLANKQDATEFSEEDAYILSIQAAQVGRIYENGSLYRQIKLRNTQLQEEIDERIRVENALQKSSDTMHHLIMQAPISIAMFDRNMDYLACSHSWVADHGRGHENLLWKNHYKIIPFAEKWREIHQLGFTGQTLKNDEDFWIGPDGKKHWIRWVMVPWNDDSGAIGGIIISLEDITESRIAEEELRIAAIAFETQGGIIVTDADDHILKVNQAFSIITGYNAEEVIWCSPQLLRSNRHEPEFYQEKRDTLARDYYWQGEIWQRRKNGEEFPEWLTVTAVLNDLSNISHYVYSFFDLTHRKEAEERIEHLALYDSLTNLPNRRLLHDKLHQTINNITRRQYYGTLLCIDLDNFKILNDTQGHALGDLLLQEVAGRLQDCIGETDTLARLGGDEFVVLLENLDGDQQNAGAASKTIAEKILVELNKPFALADYNYHTSASIGICLFRHQEMNAEELLKRTDAAMYQAKSAGKNTFRFYDPAIQDALVSRAGLEHDLRDALSKGQLYLYYQMQAYHNHQIISAEILLRWLHPEHGLISPAKFIPLAEETGLIIPIGQWVLNSTCAQLKLWKKNINTAFLNLSINVSARQFHQDDFVDQVKQAILDNNIDPDRLDIELTESVVLDDVTDTIRKMEALREFGVRFSMDDFGTGYSSLSYLTRLPLNKLKIDQSFVRNIGVSESDSVIVQTIIGMAYNLGMEVIAEGVETEEQRQFLEAHGCPVCQGYLFSKPIPLPEFEELLTNS